MTPEGDLALARPRIPEGPAHPLDDDVLLGRERAPDLDASRKGDRRRRRQVVQLDEEIGHGRDDTRAVIRGRSDRERRQAPGCVGGVAPARSISTTQRTDFAPSADAADARERPGVAPLWPRRERIGRQTRASAVDELLDADRQSGIRAEDRPCQHVDHPTRLRLSGPAGRGCNGLALLV